MNSWLSCSYNMELNVSVTALINKQTQIKYQNKISEVLM